MNDIVQRTMGSRRGNPGDATLGALFSLMTLLFLATDSNESYAQSSEKMTLEEVVVTARRREENIQDVPISISFMNQQLLSNANILSVNDLATYTPSLQSNTRFGADATTFAIRGFTQELRTTASVGVYFAEVVAARGANTSSSGDGAGPGDFFDLQNVQVLKGPQGTLFGRNTTGGAVLITPRLPGDEFEGYAEVSVGNYDMQRLQGVVNIPVNDSFRLRLGVDHQKRDGYLENKSGIGPGEFADLDYTAFRVSAIFDITDSLENYTIFKTVDSKNDNSPASLFMCNPDAGGLGTFYAPMCADDLANRAAQGADGHFDVWSNLANPTSEIEQWQLINTTSWDMSEDIRLKNIFSYAETETRYESMVYATNFNFGVLDSFLGLPDGFFADREFIFAMAGHAEGINQSDSRTVINELQLQGTSLGDRLEWQAGIYYEKTKPVEDYGSQSPGSNSCDRSTIKDPEPQNWRCNDVLGQLIGFPYGSIGSGTGGVIYENKAVYGQGTYYISDKYAMTLGLRYTDDKSEGYVEDVRAFFPGNYSSTETFAPDQVNSKLVKSEADSEEPTWVVGFDYTPNADTLLYASYTRGYRQGGVNLAADEPVNIHDPESVDTYEIGAKMTFNAAVAGTLNLAVFYNDFTDQQIQLGYFSTSGAGTTAIVNAGASTIQGAEVEANLALTENLRLAASYAYLGTEVDELVFPDLVGMGITLFPPSPTTSEGESLPFAPEHQLVTTLHYSLPIDPKLGNINLSATYSYSDSYLAFSKALTQSPLAELDSYELVNLNINWIRVAGSKFDVSLFSTNLLDEEYITYATGNWSSLGLESGQVGMPRMYGARVRYSFD